MRTNLENKGLKSSFVLALPKECRVDVATDTDWVEKRCADPECVSMYEASIGHMAYLALVGSSATLNLVLI